MEGQYDVHSHFNQLYIIGDFTLQYVVLEKQYFSSKTILNQKCTGNSLTKGRGENVVRKSCLKNIFSLALWAPRMAGKVQTKLNILSISVIMIKPAIGELRL